MAISNAGNSFGFVASYEYILEGIVFSKPFHCVRNLKSQNQIVHVLHPRHAVAVATTGTVL